MVIKNKYFSTLIITVFLSYLSQILIKRYYLDYACHEITMLNQYSSKQAFLFLDYPFVNINRHKNRFISQEIIITGIENRLLKQRLLKLLSINEYPSQIISKKELKLWVSKLKLSGFFTNIKLNSSIIQSHQIIRIHLSTTPILKQVSLIEYTDKIIPYSYLLFIFRHQVGYPISLNKIDESLALITQWYNNRGYKWAAVTVSINQPSFCHAVVDIKEGIISRIEFVNCSRNLDIVNNSNYIPIALLLEIMQLHPLQPLNIIHLEQGILRLKKQKLILHCHYEVSYNNQRQGNLSLLLKIDMIDQRSTYLFNKHIAISKYIVELIEILLKYSLGNMLENSIRNNIFSQQRSYLALRDQNRLVNTDNILYSRFSQEQNYFKSFKSQKLLNTDSYFHLWHMSKFLFIIADHLGFRHYIQNLAVQHSYCIFDISFPGINTKPYFKLQYEFPWRLNKHLNLEHFIINIFSHVFSSSNQSDLFPLDQLGNSYFCYQESLGNQAGLSLELFNNSNIYVYHRKIIYTHIASKYMHTRNYTHWNQLSSLKRGTLFYQKHSYFSQGWTHSVEQITQCHMNFIYNDQETKANGSGIYCKSIHLIPHGKSQIFYDQPNGLNYSNKTSIGLNKTCNLKNHKLQYAVELAYLFGNREYLPPSQEIIEIEENLVRGYSKEVFPFPLKFGKINLEYHIPFSARNTVFCFIDYSRYIVHCDTSWKHNLCLSRFRYPVDYKHYNQFSCGLGLHVSIPIKQIPPLRLEYSYNFNNKPSIHLRVYK